MPAKVLPCGVITNKNWNAEKKFGLIKGYQYMKQNAVLTDINAGTLPVKYFCHEDIDVFLKKGVPLKNSKYV